MCFGSTQDTLCTAIGVLAGCELGKRDCKVNRNWELEKELERLSDLSLAACCKANRCIPLCTD